MCLGRPGGLGLGFQGSAGPCLAPPLPPGVWGGPWGWLGAEARQGGGEAPGGACPACWRASAAPRAMEPRLRGCLVAVALVSGDEGGTASGPDPC